MLYYDFQAGAKNYKLRINTRNLVLLEKKLGANPLSVFYGAEDQIKDTPVETMVAILHASLQQYHANIDLDTAYEIFDQWLADGNIVVEFIAVIVEIYTVSGLLKTEKN